MFPLFGLALLTLSTVFSTDKSSFRTRVIVCWVSLASALATVDALKDSFARLRPAGTLLQSYAFPSGHTCGSNLLMGLFLFLLLDPLWDSTQNMSVSEDSDSDQGVEQMGAPFNLTKDSSSGFRNKHNSSWTNRGKSTLAIRYFGWSCFGYDFRECKCYVVSLFRRAR